MSDLIYHCLKKWKTCELNIKNRVISRKTYKFYINNKTKNLDKMSNIIYLGQKQIDKTIDICDDKTNYFEIDEFSNTLRKVYKVTTMMFHHDTSRKEYVDFKKMMDDILERFETSETKNCVLNDIVVVGVKHEYCQDLEYSSMEYEYYNIYFYDLSE